MTNSPIDISKIPEGVLAIIARLDQAGYETWLVGGCVRDLCLGLVPKDYDLATNALPDDVEKLFQRSFATGREHGTITVLWDKLAVEITTFRSESDYSDSRRPDNIVFQSRVEYDLARRDFTMNSMAWRPDQGLMDLHGGLLDLQQGLLRTVGQANARFGEDALRMLRGIRFAVTYDLTPDPDLVSAAGVHADRLQKLSRERIVGELLRILPAPYPGQLMSFAGCGLLAASLKILMNIDADDRRLCKVISKLGSPALDRSQLLPLLLLSAADDLKPATLKVWLTPWFKRQSGHALQHLLMHECRISRALAQAGEAMLYLFWLSLEVGLDRPASLACQRCFLRLTARRYHLAQEQLPDLAKAASDLMRRVVLGKVTGHRFSFSNDALDGAPLTVSKLVLNGGHLQKAGFKPGPPMRLILERLLTFVIADPALNKPADLMALAIQIAPDRASGRHFETNLSCLPDSDL